jgi:hypothetical protein
MAKKKESASQKRQRAEFRRAMVKADAKIVAAKIIGLVYDDQIPHFLMEAMLVALFDAGRELGILDEWKGFWPFNPEPDREVAKDLEIVEAICLAGGPHYELKGGE